MISATHWRGRLLIFGVLTALGNYFRPVDHVITVYRHFHDSQKRIGHCLTAWIQDPIRHEDSLTPLPRIQNVVLQQVFGGNLVNSIKINKLDTSRGS